jgi:hypothetical protein
MTPISNGSQIVTRSRLFREPVYSRAMAAGEDITPVSSYKLTRSAIVGIALVSAVYFADIVLKVSHKCFWLDELYQLSLPFA